MPQLTIDLAQLTIDLVHEDRELPFDVRPERCVRYGDSEASRQLAGEKLVKGARAIGLIA